jgi:hypothetical protein
VASEPEIPDERNPVTHKKDLTATVTGKAQFTGKGKLETRGIVIRGLNELRLAVLGILVGIGLAVGFGVEASWWVQLVAGVGSFALACFLVWWSWSRRWLMSFVHRLIGR